ncbi:ABC transporter permease [Leucobacter insecticola]|uniref:ABC transporter permease n=1 Tax=Leucobacter insecticola TaxID=2714934 RepID=A0A6G8FJM4_9MICO|nr:ABC transporter permease [Leucobacter insecticola]QIM16262.1 ABC transporter permease [Leucobacter insecticola]
MTIIKTPDTAATSLTHHTPRVLARFLASRQVRWGIALLAVMLLFALLGPLFTPYPPAESIAFPYAPPGDGLLLGADQLGRDVFSRVLAGGVSLAWMAPLAAILGVLIGALIGMVAAYAGGWTDTILMRIMDVLLAFPGLLLALMFVSVLGPSSWLLVALVIIALVPGVARVIRGATLPICRREFVLWAQSVGTPNRTILLREILPNITSPLLVEFGVRLMWAVGILASISFIGYGIQPPTPDWGLMVSENRTGLTTQPLAVLVPIIMIALFTIGGNLISEGGARVIARTEGN